MGGELALWSNYPLFAGSSYFSPPPTFLEPAGGWGPSESKQVGGLSYTYLFKGGSLYRYLEKI